jgi:hypothetical protein
MGHLAEDGKMFGQSGPAGKPKPRAETIRYSQSGIGVGPAGLC